MPCLRSVSQLLSISTGLSSVNSRNIGDLVIRNMATPSTTGASEASSGIGRRCPSAGSAGISTATLAGAGGSRGGRL